MTNNKDMSLEDMLREAAAEKDIRNREQSKHTAQDLRQQVLVHGVHMIEKLQSSIYNKDEDISSEQSAAYDKLWPVIEDLIRQTSDLKIIEAKNASEVLEAVTAGKMTLKDAALMMALLKDQVTIDELPKLLEKLSEMENV